MEKNSPPISKSWIRVWTILIMQTTVQTNWTLRGLQGFTGAYKGIQGHNSEIFYQVLLPTWIPKLQYSHAITHDPHAWSTTHISIHWSHYLFSDWTSAYSEFSKLAPVTSSNCRLYNNHVKDTRDHGRSCLVWPWCMISKCNHIKYARFVLLAVSEEAKIWLLFLFNVW